MTTSRFIQTLRGRQNSPCFGRTAFAMMSVLVGAATIAAAEPTNISGDVRDEAENPVNGATVVLIDDNCAGGGGSVDAMKSANRVCSESASTSWDGKFSFAPRADFYPDTIVVSHLTHEILRSPLTDDMDRGHVRITLRSSETKLKTVETASASQLARNSNMLKAASEPALCSDDRVGSGKTSYRFIWGRSFSPLVVVEIDMGAADEQSISLRYKEWDGNKQKLIKSVSRSVSDDVRKKWQAMKEWDRKDPQMASEVASGYFEKEAANELLDIREKEFAEVWNLPYLRQAENSIMVDGSSWIIEAIKDRNCHIVERLSPPKENAVRRLAEDLLRLSMQTLNYFEVY
jgi:hypothetical protein